MARPYAQGVAVVHMNVSKRPRPLDEENIETGKKLTMIAAEDNFPNDRLDLMLFFIAENRARIVWVEA